MTNWHVAWVTGASTGIGRELAIQLAKKNVRVAASARTKEKLEELTETSEYISSFPLDVTEPGAVAGSVMHIEETVGPIDLAILNAGIWQPVSAKDFDSAVFKSVMDVNYLGAVHALDALLPRMMRRKGGHIVLVASVSGYFGMPLAGAYGPSKAAMINLAEGLKLDLERYGITISVVNPGFVDTPMTKVNKFPMPFLVSVEAAAKQIVSGLERRKFEITFPWQLVTLMKIGRLLPYPLFFWFLKKFMSR